jgi:glyoxylase-like metal-dependent hydrolase (beta-lactamase superfamily II)
MSTGVRRVILLTLGWEELPKAWSVHGTPPHERLTEPVPGVLVEIDRGWLLLDTGFNPSLIRDPALLRRFHDTFFGIVPILPPGDGDPLLDALETVGIELDDIELVAVSHLHNDHAGGLRHFAGRRPVHLQRSELSYPLEQPVEAERNGIYRIDFDDPAIDWRLADGDVEIAPGVTAIRTAGHTPGHQSFVVRYDHTLGGGGFVFAFDAADLQENIDDELAVGGVIGCDPAETIDHIRRLKSIAASEGLRLVPGHDPQVWPKLTEELRGSDGLLYSRANP